MCPHVSTSSRADISVPKGGVDFVRVKAIEGKRVNHRIRVSLPGGAGNIRLVGRSRSRRVILLALFVCGACNCHRV